jgi:hypothetical protein
MIPRVRRTAKDDRTLAVAATALVLLGIALYFVAVGPAPPPGFIRDEASISYNAQTLSQNLHDQNGGVAPLYIKSFGDYKSPLFVYLLAGVFRITGPGKSAALATAGVAVLAAVLLLGLLAWRRTRSLLVTGSTVVLAGLTPWLYELGRTAYDTTIEPLLIVLVLVVLDWAYRSTRRPVVRAIPLGVALAGLSYSYAAGRLLSPLWAVALIVFAGRGRWRWLLSTWAVYVLFMLPLVVYSFVHTGALSARYESTTFIHHGMSAGTIVGDFLSNYAHDVNLWHWLTSGDPTPYIHVAGAPQLFAATVVLAAVGVIAIARRHRRDLFWRFVLVALVLSPVPAALTEDRFASLRLLPLPILLTALAIPGVEALRQASLREWAPRFVAAALALVLGAQLWQWADNYDANNGGRALLFESGVPALLQRAFGSDRTVYIDHDDVYAQTHALWYATTHGISTDRVSILPDGGAPAGGSMVFGRLQPCDYACTHLVDYSTYWIARADTPKG